MTASVCVADLIPKELDLLGAELRAGSEGTPMAGISATLLSYASAHILDAVRETLQGDVFEWLARAWGTARELHAYRVHPQATALPAYTAAGGGTLPAHPDKPEPQEAEATLVWLGEHTLTCTAQPVVTVTVQHQSFRIDRFSVAVTAELHAAALIVRSGCITGVRAGEGRATAVLKFGDHPLHDPLPWKPIGVPGKLQFPSPGYRIV